MEIKDLIAGRALVMGVIYERVGKYGDAKREYDTAFFRAKRHSSLEDECQSGMRRVLQKEVNG